ncbi:hypothetical protein J437_LFUL003710 [Ladona fulva]|uniref:Uncharacterized protein n=1 Tax=Ladona fulva TaxID=123851 RepID=A0A8K0NW35_LADFU|nr:hypothetical protein J437_LFUL003710 [Ladona fulva]
MPSSLTARLMFGTKSKYPLYCVLWIIICRRKRNRKGVVRGCFHRTGEPWFGHRRLSWPGGTTMVRTRRESAKEFTRISIREFYTPCGFHNLNPVLGDVAKFNSQCPQ